MIFIPTLEEAHAIVHPPERMRSNCTTKRKAMKLVCWFGYAQTKKEARELVYEGNYHVGGAAFGITCQLHQVMEWCWSGDRHPWIVARMRSNKTKHFKGLTTRPPTEDSTFQSLTHPRSQVRGRKQRRRSRIACWFMEIKNVLVLFELDGKGFFFFFVVVKNGFDMFCNVVQVMLENTFTQFVDFVSSFESLL